MGKQGGASRGAAKKVVLLGLGLVIFGGVAVAGVRAMRPKAPVEVKPEAVIVPLGSFIINLNPKDGFRYLKATAALSVTGHMSAGKLKEKAMEHKFQWSDLLVKHLSGQTYSEIFTPEGRARLERDLVKLLSRASGEVAVDAVYFSEFVAQ